MSTDRHTDTDFVRTKPPTAEELFGDEKPHEIELGMLQMQILWLLSQKSTHGYELMKDLETIKGKKITQGTLYPTLQKLEKLGYIRGQYDDNKVVYSTTSKGAKVMNETCTDFVKTFFGIFNQVACTKCVGHDHSQKKV